MVDHPVLVAGGGIAGLAAALSLARQGESTILLEREARFSEVGAGLQLGPNAVAALRAIGAWDAVEPITSQPPEIHMRDGRDGRLLKRLRLTKVFEQRYGAPYRVAHRADVHAALLAMCRANPRIDLRNGTPLEDFVQSSTSVTVNGELQGRCLLAADGVHSVTRQILMPGTKAVDSGFIFHRALQHAVVSNEVDYACVNLWMLPNAHVVHYPVGRDQRLNLVCVSESSETVDQIQRRCCRALGLLLAQMSFSPWPGLFAPAPSQWRFDRVTLIGDAAHGTLPFLAQGAAMALEDAASLQRIDNVWTVPQSRLQRTARLHRQTLSTGRNYHLSGAMGELRNLALGLMPQAMILRQLDWIYSQKAEAVGAAGM